MDWSFIVIIVQLVFLEGILSLDNAAVLGTMVSFLPDDQPVPWPGALRRLGRVLDPLLGRQRTAALRAGLLGAYLGRGLMLFLATLIIQNPWLKIIGAIYLIRLAFENLGQDGDGDEQVEEERRARGNSFWMVVLTVEITDLIFSLDNVVAAVSLSQQLWVVLLGVAIGILMMRFAAGLFSYAVLREPILKSAAYILVLNIGVELLLDEMFGVEIDSWLRFGISVGTILLCLLYAHLPLRPLLRAPLGWLARGMARINRLVDWLLEPLGALLRLCTQAVRLLARRPVEREKGASEAD